MDNSCTSFTSSNLSLFIDKKVYIWAIIKSHDNMVIFLETVNDFVRVIITISISGDILTRFMGHGMGTTTKVTHTYA